LVKQIQLHPVTGTPLHIEFHEVNLKEKIKANVPVVLIGESPAIKEGMGTLLHLIDEIEVEALPTDLPEHIEIDITKLAAVNDQIMIKECMTNKDVTILTDPEIIVVKIGQLTAPEPEPIAETTPTEGAEGETTAPAENGGETKGEEAPKEETK
jgi:large subunit ribosomal protein L25